MRAVEAAQRSDSWRHDPNHYTLRHANGGWRQQRPPLLESQLDEQVPRHDLLLVPDEQFLLRTLPRSVPTAEHSAVLTVHDRYVR